MDYGVKQNMIECLRRRGCQVTVFPAATPAETILAGGFDGVMLSNGPGDPADNVAIIAEVKKLYESTSPCSPSAWATSCWPWPPAPRPASWPTATGAATTR